MELEATNLACERGGRTVFTDLSFTVRAGELLVLRGPNGAGKTSLLRLIAGLIEPAAGALELSPAHEDLTIGQTCHFVAHQDALKTALSVRENLQFWSGFLGGGNVDAALAAFGLEALADYSAALLSAGQKHRASLSRLKLVRRAIWLLDEPTVGLDAAAQSRLSSLIKQHLDEGGLVIATTHVDLGVAENQVLDFAEVGQAA